MAGMTISQVAQEIGVNTSAIRYYERIGLLPQPERVSGRRRYDPAILQRLVIIQTAQQAGFSLAELRILFDDILENAAPNIQWHNLIQRKLKELNALLHNVQSMKNMLEEIMDCEDPTLAECLFATGQKHKAMT
jgi:MerR family transcriptional regulator, redox-sensitive transcriptional activator SoxR